MWILGLFLLVVANFATKKLLRLLVVFYLLIAPATHAEGWMPDKNLQQVVREALEIPQAQVLTTADMKRLNGFDGRKRGITDLTGLEHATYLQWINLGENEIRDISPLATLVHLEGL